MGLNRRLDEIIFMVFNSSGLNSVLNATEGSYSC